MASEIPKPDPIIHVAVLAFPFGSHAAPLLSLVRRLAVTTAASTVFSFLNTSRSNETIFPCKDGVPNVMVCDVEDGLPKGHAPSGNPIEQVEMFLRATPENFRKVLEEAEEIWGRKVGCLISDAFLWFAGEFAAEREVPWLPLWTAGPRSLLVHLETDLIRRNLGDEGTYMRYIYIYIYICMYI